MWYKSLDCFGLGLGYLRFKSDHSMYDIHDGDNSLIITSYVDDMLLFGNSKDVIHDLKSHILCTISHEGLGV